MFTKEQKLDYITKNGQRCPFCNGKDIQASRPELMDYGVEVEINCENCGKTYKELYTLSDIAIEES